MNQSLQRLISLFATLDKEKIEIVCEFLPIEKAIRYLEMLMKEFPDNKKIFDSAQNAHEQLFHTLEECLRKHDTFPLESGFLAGILFSAAFSRASRKSPGPGNSSHWKIAEEIFIKKEKDGKRMTEGRLWLECKSFMQSAKLPVSRESFGRTYKRKVKKWRESV